MTKKRPWLSYEEVAAFLLNTIAERFQLSSVESKQSVKGKNTGADYEIDAKGVLNGSDMFLIIECKRHTESRIKQKDAAALGFQIQDTGAAGGIIVSCCDLQRGARMIAESTKIYSVILSPESTTTNYVLKFLHEVRIGLCDSLTVNVSLVGGAYEKTRIERATHTARNEARSREIPKQSKPMSVISDEAI